VSAWCDRLRDIERPGKGRRSRPQPFTALVHWGRTSRRRVLFEGSAAAPLELPSRQGGARLHRAAFIHVAFRGGEPPHFTTLNLFRLEHREALSGLLCRGSSSGGRAGLSALGHVSLDGSTVQAHAGKHKAMSYGPMKEQDKRLAAEIEALLFRADETDRREDEPYGREGRADELPEEFHRRDARLRRIRQAKAALEKEAAEARAAQLRERAATRAAKSRQQAEKLSPRANDDDDDDAASGNAATELPSHRVPATAQGEPTDKAQRNFTDPESCIRVRNGVFLQAYNAQAAVSESQGIVAHAVTNQPPDPQHLLPRLERVREHCGCLPELLSADSCYASEGNAGLLRSQRARRIHRRRTQRPRRPAGTAADDTGARGALAHASGR
jgi:hypothetical protein